MPIAVIACLELKAAFASTTFAEEEGILTLVNSAWTCYSGFAHAWKPAPLFVQWIPALAVATAPSFPLPRKPFFVGVEFCPLLVTPEGVGTLLSTLGLGRRALHLPYQTSQVSPGRIGASIGNLVVRRGLCLASVRAKCCWGVALPVSFWRGSGFNFYSTACFPGWLA